MIVCNSSQLTTNLVCLIEQPVLVSINKSAAKGYGKTVEKSSRKVSIPDVVAIFCLADSPYFPSESPEFAAAGDHPEEFARVGDEPSVFVRDTGEDGGTEHLGKKDGPRGREGMPMPAECG